MPFQSNLVQKRKWGDREGGKKRAGHGQRIKGRVSETWAYRSMQSGEGGKGRAPRQDGKGKNVGNEGGENVGEPPATAVTRKGRAVKRWGPRHKMGGEKTKPQVRQRVAAAHGTEGK